MVGCIHCLTTPHGLHKVHVLPRDLIRFPTFSPHLPVTAHLEKGEGQKGAEQCV